MAMMYIPQPSWNRLRAMVELWRHVSGIVLTQVLVWFWRVRYLVSGSIKYLPSRPKSNTHHFLQMPLRKKAPSHNMTWLNTTYCQTVYTVKFINFRGRFTMLKNPNEKIQHMWVDRTINHDSTTQLINIFFLYVFSLLKNIKISLNDI